MLMINHFLTPFITAWLLSGILMPFIIFICHRRGWFDAKDHRKIHAGNIPRLGGIGIFLGWLGGAFLTLTILNYANGDPLPANSYRLVLLVLCAATIHGTGLWDDFSNLRPRNKFMIQLAIALVTALGGVRFYTLAIPFTDVALEFFPLSFLVTLVWIVGVSNAVNLIDGLDGLSSMVSFIAAMAMGILSANLGKPITALLCFALAGSTFGFFLFNRPPAKIFMGDSGSLFLGYILATLPLLEEEKMPTHILGLSITILLIPVADTLFAMGRRLRRKHPIASPDREHIHHLLLGLGLSNWAILGIMGGYGIALAAIPLILISNYPKFFSAAMILLWGTTFFLIHHVHKLWNGKKHQ